jgi:ADP-ribose pyrophosphatase YjhB (NUDIX family)
MKEDRILFIRQAYGVLEGQWSIPWGFVDADETPDQAALRETFEEAGITAELGGLLGIQNRQHGAEQWLYLLFLARHVDGEPTHDGHETDQAAYLSREELDTLPVDSFCKWLACKVLDGEYHLILAERDNPYSPHLAFL